MIPANDDFESVWDYPRPPRLERSRHRLSVMFEDVTIADTRSGYRVLETSHPPTYYFPPSDVALGLLKKADGSSICEFKGVAEYLSISVGDRISVRAAWVYPAPEQSYAAIAGYIAFYPSRVDACFVGPDKVVAQEGDFYGGWITPGIRGPFKGGPGSAGW
jgi:uncharacterized protein (DUF427 family)